jgi:hypothetical protein
VRLDVEPTADSWRTVARLIDAQEGGCGFVLEKIDALGMLRNLLADGIEVRLPTEKVEPITIPVAIEAGTKVAGSRLDVHVKLGELVIRSDALWLGANVRAGAAASSGP